MKKSNVLVAILACLSFLALGFSPVESCTPELSKKLKQYNLSDQQAKEACRKIQAMADLISDRDPNKNKLTFFWKDAAALKEFKKMSFFARGLARKKRPVFKNMDLELVFFPGPEAIELLKRNLINGFAFIAETERARAGIGRVIKTFPDHVLIAWDVSLQAKADLSEETSRVARFDIHNFRLGMTIAEAKKVHPKLTIDKFIKRGIVVYFYAHAGGVQVYFDRGNQRIYQVIYRKIIYSDRRPNTLEIMRKAEAKYGKSDSGIMGNSLLRSEYALWGKRDEIYLELGLDLVGPRKYQVKLELVNKPMIKRNDDSWYRDLEFLKRKALDKQVKDLKF